MKKRDNKLLIMLVVFTLAIAAAIGCSDTPAPDAEITLAPLDDNDDDTVVPEVQVSPLMSPPETPLPSLAVEPGYAGVQGYMGYRDPKALGKMIIYFCPFTPNETGEDGIYLLDPSVHPRVIVNEDRWFQSGSIEPGMYVLVVGEEPASAKAVYDVERPGHTAIFELVEGEILEIAVDDALVTIPTEE